MSPAVAGRLSRPTGRICSGTIVPARQRATLRFPSVFVTSPEAGGHERTSTSGWWRQCCCLSAQPTIREVACRQAMSDLLPGRHRAPPRRLQYSACMRCAHPERRLSRRGSLRTGFFEPNSPPNPPPAETSLSLGSTDRPIARRCTAQLDQPPHETQSSPLVAYRYTSSTVVTAQPLPSRPPRPDRDRQTTR